MLSVMHSRAIALLIWRVDERGANMDNRGESEHERAKCVRRFGTVILLDFRSIAWYGAWIAYRQKILVAETLKIYALIYNSKHHCCATNIEPTL